MKRTITAITLAAGLVVAALPLAAATSFGKGVQGKEAVKVTELIANPDKYVGKTISVEGLVTDVCSKRGCWMTLAGDKELQTVRIKVDDGVIVFPTTAKGRGPRPRGLLEDRARQGERHQVRQAPRRGERKAVRPRLGHGPDDDLPGQGDRRRHRLTRHLSGRRLDEGWSVKAYARTVLLLLVLVGVPCRRASFPIRSSGALRRPSSCR